MSWVPHRRMIGVLGGMGPMATIDFMAKIAAATPAGLDQEHVPLIVHNVPQIPDRSTAILQGSDAPFLPMLAGIRLLESSGVDLVAIPCNTAHFWYDRLARSCNVEILHIADAAAAAIAALPFPVNKVVLLATRGTIEAGIYQARLKQSVKLVIPDEPAQQDVDQIIADVKASQTLFDEIARLGGKPLMWKTGHSLIKSKMIETGARLAGEMSGHIFFADDYYGYDDALYAAVRLLRVIGKSGSSLAQLRDRLAPAVNTPEIRIACDDARKFAVVAKIAETLHRDGADVDTTDGVRVRRADGWWLLRASNTQAILVARAEASDRRGLDLLLAEIRRHLADQSVAFDIAPA